MMWKAAWIATNLLKLSLIPEFTMMLVPVHSFCSNRPKQRRKADGKHCCHAEAYRVLLWRGPAVEAVWEVERKLQLPGESHTITQDESKEEHFGRTKGKQGEEERVNQKVKPAVWKCLIFTTVRRRTLTTTFKFGHNQTLNLPLQEYRNCSARVIFFRVEGPSEAALLYLCL